MSEITLPDLIFYVVGGLVALFGAYAALARNFVRAVFALLGLFLGVAVLYGLLAADFLAVVQLLVYVGGILVLLLFAVMLTANIDKAENSNRSGGILLGLAVGAVLLTLLVPLAISAPWHTVTPNGYDATTATLGQVLMGPALLPFEVLGILLLAVVIGAVVVARKPKVQDIEEPGDVEQPPPPLLDDDGQPLPATIPEPTPSSSTEALS